MKSLTLIIVGILMFGLVGAGIAQTQIFSKEKPIQSDMVNILKENNITGYNLQVDDYEDKLIVKADNFIIGKVNKTYTLCEKVTNYFDYKNRKCETLTKSEEQIKEEITKYENAWLIDKTSKLDKSQTKSRVQPISSTVTEVSVKSAGLIDEIGGGVVRLK